MATTKLLASSQVHGGWNPHEQKSSKFALGPLTEHMGAFPHPCAIRILMGILHFVYKIHDFVKLQGDVQKVCKNMCVLTHRVRDPYVFIGKSMGGTPTHGPRPP